VSKISKQHLVSFLQTAAGGNALREAGAIASREIISAAKYYMGVPDGKYFEAKDFDSSVVNAKKAYVTLNTIMGGETAEEDRFNEGKKQVPGLLTPLGVKKMINLFTLLYCFASGDDVTDHLLETVRACRQTEISEGHSTVEALSSTTKLSIDEIMELGYGNKNGLAICLYNFYEGAVVFDMERLGKEYLKPEEREVLLMMGNQLVATCLDYDSRFLGKDGKPALLYRVDVYPPYFGDCKDSQEELEKIVYDPDNIKTVQAFYTALNEEHKFPSIPACYHEWKDSFKKLVFMELSKFAN